MCGSNHQSEEHQTGEGPTVRPLPSSSLFIPKQFLKSGHRSSVYSPYMSRFKGTLHICLLQITGYSSLYLSVEDLRKEVFNSENQEHEAMLLKVRFHFQVHEKERELNGQLQDETHICVNDNFYFFFMCIFFLILTQRKKS